MFFAVFAITDVFGGPDVGPDVLSAARLTCVAFSMVNTHRADIYIYIYMFM